MRRSSKRAPPQQRMNQLTRHSHSHTHPTPKPPPPPPPFVTTGSTTTLSNYYLHRDKPLAALSCAGLALIFGSNAPFDWLPAALHESRLWNTLGCGMLIGSSWLAHRGEAGGGGGHGHHSHVHGHSHGHEGEGEKGKEEKEK